MNSISSLLTLLAGLLILGGACYLVATKRHPSVLAAYFVLLPLPVFIIVCATLKGMISSLTVIAASPKVTETVTTADLAAATADALLSLLVALLISAPTYFVLAIGLLLRTLRFPTDPAAPAPIRSARPVPLPSSAGSVPATS